MNLDEIAKPTANDPNASGNPPKPETSLSQTTRELYPSVNNRLTGMLKWLALVFVLGVFYIQFFSGYS